MIVPASNFNTAGSRIAVVINHMQAWSCVGKAELLWIPGWWNKLYTNWLWKYRILLCNVAKSRGTMLLQWNNQIGPDPLQEGARKTGFYNCRTLTRISWICTFDELMINYYKKLIIIIACIYLDYMSNQLLGKNFSPIIIPQIFLVICFFALGDKIPVWFTLSSSVGTRTVHQVSDLN